ncbi:hypothetical protein L6452_43332 [Arctium lappa]|uniref:Uncharacterized protein n=1 Tax=Arctium lappa TaxID=4217 RepID=A0ACB8XK77_ARCLA|nr:hypothetical protein L6452_43332 [Arctium lappa]
MEEAISQGQVIILITCWLKSTDQKPSTAITVYFTARPSTSSSCRPSPFCVFGDLTLLTNQEGDVWNPNLNPSLNQGKKKKPNEGIQEVVSSIKLLEDWFCRKVPDSDIEQQRMSPPIPYFELTERMPHLTDPQVLDVMRSTVADDAIVT